MKETIPNKTLEELARLNADLSMALMAGNKAMMQLIADKAAKFKALHKGVKAGSYAEIRNQCQNIIERATV